MTAAGGKRPYPPLSDYAFISDCHSAALVSRNGSIDWCCMPRFDSGSCFGRLLDWERGGFYVIEPADEDLTVFQEYIEGALVLSTTLRTADGEARVLDCFVLDADGSPNPHRRIMRLVDGVRGHTTLRATIAPRFDYGDVRPWLRMHEPRTFSATGGDDAIVLWSDAPLEIEEDEHALSGE